MLMTTTPGVEGKTIRAHHGIVAGEAIIGANFLKDMFAAVRDFVGGRAGAYEKTLRAARNGGIGAAHAAASHTTVSPRRRVPPLSTRAVTPPWPRIAL